MKKRALISVSNKENIIDFANNLTELGVEIISTGGTLRVLKEAGIPAFPVDEVTGFPEILDGRVKTLHPLIHGGLLAKRSEAAHMEQLEANQITPIDFVIVNLYPFKQTLEQEGVSHEEVIENIDIGGPTMLRAAAKNYADITVVVDPADYSSVIENVRNNSLDMNKRQQLAAKVFRHTANYDALIANYFTEQTEERFPETYTITYEKAQNLRYGENPHQEAAFYRKPLSAGMNLATAQQLHGKELSYNNIQDANAALEIIAEYLESPAVVAVKHMNPCGIGVAETISKAFDRAYEADPISIFGGIIASNREIDEETAKELSKIFLEIVLAPGFTEDALDILTQKKNIRLLKLDMDTKEETTHKVTSVGGGVLIQTQDDGMAKPDELTVVTKRQPTEQELTDLLFAWKAVKHVKSNAIVLAKGNQTVGIGAGQMNRIGAAQIAIEQAGDKALESVLASDAFFPMPDTVEAAVKAGVTAIIQPGGSKRDEDSVKVCDAHNIAMVYTGMRHFKH
ncbi:bifunctional phosphoribosylaminoimidazolecarboxamide formyltransferase/IMP cyclohydrolase [Virgibacillus halodenitrificans]|uniref:bifunctional phosphoribosylaminoimidazolecarboxamide formyltransferase/IMP cyclohydrolase n=1 Tax=Virgibacillus halodenitrificans TaxID=1482 RepID=UPI002DB9A216|nr:bifunctional phosphoribosylaminoimidazolecarboxamide formyltransferase/IMP cyclohydrolase [Virgibacillus halodenitrificans]MEC2159404.1 bifunctional phosphoribosylaminoimidazolecarboxamide formyltransferase/IMP cyclohydrolase [Virgibacillus halodenitrificans]